MAIEWRLADLMAQQGMNYKMLGAATGMHPNTISKLKHNPPTRLEMVTLIRLCQALHCQPGELLIYIPEPVLEAVSEPSAPSSSNPAEFDASGSRGCHQLESESL